MEWKQRRALLPTNANREHRQCGPWSFFRVQIFSVHAIRHDLLQVWKHGLNFQYAEPLKPTPPLLHDGTKNPLLPRKKVQKMQKLMKYWKKCEGGVTLKVLKNLALLWFWLFRWIGAQFNTLFGNFKKQKQNKINTIQYRKWNIRFSSIYKGNYYKN